MFLFFGIVLFIGIVLFLRGTDGFHEVGVEPRAFGLADNSLKKKKKHMNEGKEPHSCISCDMEILPPEQSEGKVTLFLTSSDKIFCSQFFSQDLNVLKPCSLQLSHLLINRPSVTLDPNRLHLQLRLYFWFIPPLLIFLTTFF